MLDRRMALVKDTFMQKSKDANSLAKTEWGKIMINESHLFGHPKLLHGVPLHLIKVLDNSRASVESRSVLHSRPQTWILN